MKRFGLIGYPLGHSFSQQYFTEKFRREHIEGCSYSNFPLPDIKGLSAILDDTLLCGLNVTIPYKEQVLPWLDEQDEVVRKIGACNCIRIERVSGQPRRRLRGFNTDVIGFEQSLIGRLRPHHDRALILGTGGAAKAVEYVLDKLGIAYRFVSRKARSGSGSGMAVDGNGDRTGDDKSILSYEQVNVSLLDRYMLIINTTPLGMSPRVDECPPLPYEAITYRHYLFDLIYNPAKTLFLQKGEARGAVIENGHDMLVTQAEESWRIWNQ